MDLKTIETHALPWLLEPDVANPAVRYFALRDLLGQSAASVELRQAQDAIMATGPVPAILDAQHPDGYWLKPGAGYSPKYRSTAWQIILLAELGADPDDAQVQRGCEYLLAHTPAPNGAFSVYNPPRPSGALHCLNGNLLFALMQLGYANDARVQAALAWQIQAIVGPAGFAYQPSGTSGPTFACGVNEGQPCGWGANKALKALSAMPPAQRPEAVQQAIAVGVDFMFSRNPAAADYPYTSRVSSTWFKFGFPLTYWSDVLESTAVLAALGYGRDPRLADAVQLILDKQIAPGRWKLENSLRGKMWMDIEKQGRPSKWITLRALRVLRRCLD